MSQTIKCLPTMQETGVQSQGQEGHLEKEIATHFSILAWEIPWAEELGRLQSMGSQSRTLLSDFTSLKKKIISKTVESKSKPRLSLEMENPESQRILSSM